VTNWSVVPGSIGVPPDPRTAGGFGRHDSGYDGRRWFYKHIARVPGARLGSNRRSGDSWVAAGR